MTALAVIACPAGPLNANTIPTTNAKGRIDAGVIRSVSVSADSQKAFSAIALWPTIRIFLRSRRSA